MTKNGFFRNFDQKMDFFGILTKNGFFRNFDQKSIFSEFSRKIDFFRILTKNRFFRNFDQKSIFSEFCTKIEILVKKSVKIWIYDQYSKLSTNGEKKIEFRKCVAFKNKRYCS